MTADWRVVEEDASHKLRWRKVDKGEYNSIKDISVGVFSGEIQFFIFIFLIFMDLDATRIFRLGNGRLELNV